MKRIFYILALSVILTNVATAQQTFSWSQIADYPYNAWGMNACGHDGYLYTFSNCGGPNNNLYRYNPTADKWDTLGNLTASGICNTSIVGSGDTLYIAGSKKLHTFNIAQGQFNTATVSAPAQFEQDGASAVAINGSIYYVGGGSTNKLYRFDVATQTFTQLANMNQPRENAQVTHMGDKIYVIGGRYAGNSLNNGEAYDIATDTWTNLSATFEQRYFGYAFADTAYIYLMGGETGTNSFKYKTIELFDPATNSVTIMDPMINNMNREHTAHAMGVAGNMLIAAAGFTNTPTNATTKYSEATNFVQFTNVLKNIKQATDFTVYPNPANDILNIRVQGSSSVNKLELYNSIGELVVARQVNNSTDLHLKTGNMPSGNYFIRLSNNTGASQTRPVVIQR